MKGAKVDEGLGAGFWFKVIGVVVLGGIAVMLSFLLIEAAWYRWGFVGGFIFFGVVLLGIAYIGDRRSQQRYEDLPES
jgi:uncharacterized membrane protein